MLRKRKVEKLPAASNIRFLRKFIGKIDVPPPCWGYAYFYARNRSVFRKIIFLHPKTKGIDQKVSSPFES